MDIGGYFELDLPDHGDAFPAMLKYQSARAALRALLEASAVERVFLPVYVCDAVVQAVGDAGVAITWYRLDDTLYPVGLPEHLEESSRILYVNYFGLCQRNVRRLLTTYSARQLVVDNSQALLAPPLPSVPSLYSPRKFLGLPDGGMLANPGQHATLPPDEDEASLARMQPLLQRLASGARAGYPAFLQVEHGLADTRPLAMSRLTRRLLASADLEKISNRRRRNFAVLASALDRFNQLTWPWAPDDVPLCYPLILDRPAEPLKRALAEQNIFVPTYWREVNARAGDGMEHRLTNCSLCLPCDQRYSAAQMHELANAIILLLT